MRSTIFYGDEEIDDNVVASYRDAYLVNMTRLLLRANFLILVLAIVVSLYFGFGLNIIVSVLAVLLFFLTLDFILSPDTYSVVLGMLLWSLMILIVNFVSSRNGIFNQALMAIPGLFTLAIIFNRTLLYYSLFLFSLLVSVALGVAHTYDYIPLSGVTTEQIWPQVGLTLAVLVSSAISVRAFFGDILRYIDYLQEKLKASRQQHKHYKDKMGFDETLGVPTEYACNQVFEEFSESLRPPANMLACLLIDLKNIDQLRFSLGHKVEKAILVQLSRKYRDLTGDHTEVFLFHGNEFVFLTLEKSLEDVERLANQLLSCTRHSLFAEGHEIELYPSIGISLAPFNGDSLDALLQAARLASDEVNNDVVSRYALFEDAMRDNAERNYLLIRDLRQALARDEFELHYQPKVHLASGEIVGVEALLRWRKGESEMIPPDVFIPLAEESGLINEIGKWVLREACYQCKAWHQHGFDHLTMAVNVSPVQLRKANFPYVVMQALHDADLKAKYLEIEITESALGGQNNEVRSQIQSLASKGVPIAVDDFGTGYSNLGHLVKFNLSCLKVDQSFVRNSHTNPQDLHIIKAVLQMSKGLGLTSVAEGVEELGHLQLLAVLGCVYGQGHYWSKALPSNELLALLQNFKPVPVEVTAQAM